MEKLYRSYSVSSQEDLENITDGRCPDYALSWDTSDHQLHWCKNHDFLLGNNNNQSENRLIEREIMKHKNENKYYPKIYCELENVLTNFDDAVHKIFSEYPRHLSREKVQRKIAKTPYFYENLEWLKEGQTLWNTLKHLNPIILTTTNEDNENTKWIEIQKKNWCAKHLGENIQVIICEPNEKPLYCDEANAILIDQQMQHLGDQSNHNVAKSWSEAGGIYIHHHKDAKTTLTEILDNL